MKKRNLIANKTNLVARALLLVLFITSAMNFVGCGWLAEDEMNLDNEIPNLDNHIVSYLLFRDLEKCDYINDVDYFHYVIDGGFFVVNGVKQYTTPIIQASAEFDADGLSKKSYSIFLIKSSAISVWAHFYPIKRDIGELKYEFKYINSTKYKYHRVVYIYSDSQLVGKVYYDAQKRVPKDWIEDFLNDNLVSMTVKNYSDIESTSNKKDYISSYLSIGNIGNSQYCSNFINYRASVNGGLEIEYGSEYYTNIVNSINLEFDGDESTNNARISIQADFYENNLAFDVLRYESMHDSINNIITINIYSGDLMVGIMNIDAEEDISNEWIESFLNENLIIVEMHK